MSSIVGRIAPRLKRSPAGGKVPAQVAGFLAGWRAAPIEKAPDRVKFPTGCPTHKLK